ncbi:hypothetical protein BBP00_00002771 [Phytophthora kernoviae]|uniref:Sodium/hydrogen exchanger n=1 Tax=Phytophthora kernoviae TaxID=325452 RepID=A0A3F2RWE9_9STRA|nr:hypothetical protein BBP00_00002771 [Phytophthora kernoviae]
MKALGVIPARMGSTRFPGKPLAEFFGKTMIEHTYAAAVGSKLLSKVVVASDSEQVLRVIQGVGGATTLTGACNTGTDRIVQALHLMDPKELSDYDIVVNIQATQARDQYWRRTMGENWHPEASSDAGNTIMDTARGVASVVASSSAGDAKEQASGTEWVRLELCAIASLQLALVLVAYRLDRSHGPALISESAVAIFFGVLFGAGVLIFYPMESLNNGLDPEVLFYALLPPIILEAGFNMKKRGFFSNFNAIILLSIVGTLIATFITGGALIWIGNMGLITKLTAAEAYLYGALISAVDPVATLSVFKKNGVPPLLFNLVFGESMLNDGVAIVAFSLFQGLIRDGIEDVTLNNAGIIIIKVFGIGFGSVGLAAIVCFTSAFLLKRADPVLQQYPSYEISIVLLSAYLSYVIADLAGLSGIVALFFSGVLMSHYHLYNIADESATALRHLLTTTSFMAENFVFIYMGMSVVAYSGYFTWDWGFILANMIACLAGRMLNTFPMCILANFGRAEDDKIPWSHMVVIWFAGLRGAIAFALALNVWTPDRTHSSVIQSTTLFTVMFTTLVFGMGTSPVLRYFGLTAKQEEEAGFDDEGANERLLSSDDEHDADTSFRPIDRNVPRRKSTSIHGVWERLDEKYLKPLFGGHPRDEQQQSEPTTTELKRTALGAASSIRRAHDTVLTLEAQIEEEEAVYLEETPHGNIIRGWEGFIDSKQPRKDANPKKIKPYTEAEHLFSDCCFYGTLATEPSFDQVDIYDTAKDESASRRKLTVTLSVGKTTGANSISGAVETTATHSSTHSAYRADKGSKITSVQKTTKVVTQSATAASSYQQAAHGKMSKLKKRKREETGTPKIGDNAVESLQTTTTMAMMTAAQTGSTTQLPPGDFLDVL